MSILKHQIPILEYDPQPESVIMPNPEHLYGFPQKAVFSFLGDEIERFAVENYAQKIGEFDSQTKTFPIYNTVYKSQEICFCQAPEGASIAAQILDYLIGYGVKYVISAGNCGTLTNLPENHFLIPTEALRDEGTSYHYLPPSRTVKIDETAIRVIEQALIANGIPYSQCKTWTTDGFYRETKEMVKYRKSEGYSVVEMECSALAACAQFRGAVFGQILFTADSLANVEAHDERDWGHASFPLALKACFDAVSRF